MAEDQTHAVHEGPTWCHAVQVQPQFRGTHDGCQLCQVWIRSRGLRQSRQTGTSVAYTGRPIQKTKKDDLMKLMEFEPPCQHRWYSDIRVLNAHGPESIDGFTGRPAVDRDDK